MMRVYAEIAGLRRRLVVQVPVLTRACRRTGSGLVTPCPAGLAKPLVESLECRGGGCTTTRSRRCSPNDCLSFREAVALALQRVEHLEVDTRWSGADPAGAPPGRPLPPDPNWAGGTMFADVQQAWSPAPPDAVFRTVSGIGGRWGCTLRGQLAVVDPGLDGSAVGGIAAAAGATPRRPPAWATPSTSGGWRPTGRRACSACG